MAESFSARGISLAGCPEPRCTCGSLIVRLYDEAGNIVGGLVLPREHAALFAAQAAALTGPDARTDLSVIRCQGVA
ncbi:methylmalonyl-CoA mutase large subunit [Methylorubrum populi]|uniref:Methylmalonyl-CoA mutase large subunit n=1 Tax=Methylorubrum populi TaxID=223967 RepID=A0A160PDS4_9HYPH|nr:hypothetical protein [Methylorubrum populi]BAU91209.1 methylmalonyl-CoA mutase large subunit [Methylorubrum populi]